MAPSPSQAASEQTEPVTFRVALGDFEGPFDLLLSLITKHELDITEISLSRVTDEFIAYLRGLDSADSLDEASEFLLVAATLLDLKVAGLLPQGELVDAESTRHTRTVRLEDKYRQRTPELVWTLTAEDFAALGTLALTPREIPVVGLDHLHAPLVSIREQAAHVVGMLRSGEPLTFRQLVAGADQKGVVIARFLAVLELYRHSAIAFEQLEPLGELTVRWTAEHWSQENLSNLGADYDG